MKLLPLLLFQLITLISLTSHAQDGQALHQSECIECHSRMTGGDGHVIYSRDDRIVKNISELKARVAHCSNGSSTDWNENQIDTVVNYLNEKYYSY